MHGVRRLILLSALLLCGAVGARAQDLPQLYDVVGVALDDVLNIRAEPNARSEIIGSLGPVARAVEVTAFSGDGWARVNRAEGSGWVSARFLIPAQQAAWWDRRSLLTCYGTEPFWSLRIDGDRATFDSPLGPEAPQPILARSLASGAPGVLGLRLADGVAVIRAVSCSDGMSKRAYGLAIELFRGSGEGWGGNSGCCTLGQ